MYNVQCSWSPKGQLIAHVNEHKEAINRWVLASYPGTTCTSRPTSLTLQQQITQITLSLVPGASLLPFSVSVSEFVCRICALMDSSVFATFSDDGTTKIWDMAKLEGRNHVNRAKLTYSSQGKRNAHSWVHWMCAWACVHVGCPFMSTLDVHVHTRTCTCLINELSSTCTCTRVFLCYGKLKCFEEFDSKLFVL